MFFMATQALRNADQNRRDIKALLQRSTRWRAVHLSRDDIWFRQVAWATPMRSLRLAQPLSPAATALQSLPALEAHLEISYLAKAQGHAKVERLDPAP
jgi:hypothetical protein